MMCTGSRQFPHMDAIRQFNEANSKVKLLWTGVSSPMFESAIKGRYG